PSRGTRGDIAASPFGARRTVTRGPLFPPDIFDAITLANNIISLLCPALHRLRSPFNYEIRRTPRTAGDARPGVVFRAPTHSLVGARVQLLCRLQTHVVPAARCVPGRRTGARARESGGRR